MTTETFLIVLLFIGLLAVVAVYAYSYHRETTQEMRERAESLTRIASEAERWQWIAMRAESSRRAIARVVVGPAKNQCILVGGPAHGQIVAMDGATQMVHYQIKPWESAIAVYLRSNCEPVSVAYKGEVHRFYVACFQTDSPTTTMGGAPIFALAIEAMNLTGRNK